LRPKALADNRSQDCYFSHASILCWLRDSSSASLGNEYCPVLGILVVLRFPFGTALGIYTLWVLAPEESAREYDQLVNSGVQITAQDSQQAERAERSAPRWKISRS